MSLSINDFEAVVQRAIAHRDGGDLKAAIAVLMRLLRSAIAIPLCLFNAGLLMGNWGDLMRQLLILTAQSLWLQMIPGCGANRAIACGLMGQFDAAIDSFGKAVALDPENTQALASRGETLREMGRFEEALGDLNLVLALDADILVH